MIMIYVDISSDLIMINFPQIMRAVYDYTAEEEDELSFSAGDILYIVDRYIIQGPHKLPTKSMWL